MRFERLALSGLGPFSNVSIDLAGIEGVIVAIAGDNGQGKSTLLELLPGALYRETPTRGSLADLATARDSYVEVEVVNGARYTIRQTVDAVSGKGESLVLDASGKPVLASAKLKEFDSWAKSHIVSPEVMFASTFMPQGSGGFLELKAGDRKACLLRALGVERLERLASDARERARAAKGQLDVLVARMGELAGGADIDAAQAELASARQASADADLALEHAKAELARVEEQRRQVQEAARKSEELQRQRLAVRTRLNAAEAKRDGLRARQREVAAIVAQTSDIRAAIERIAEIDVQVSGAQTTKARLQAESEAARQQEQDAASQAADARRRAQVAQVRAESRRQAMTDGAAASRAKIADLEARVGNNRGLLARAAEIHAAVALDNDLSDQLRAVELARVEIAAELDAAVSERIHASELVRKAEVRLAEATTKARRASEALADESAILEAAAKVPGLRAAFEAAGAAVLEAEHELEALRGQRLAGAEDRIGGLRSGLGSIAKGGADPKGIAADTLSADDATVAAARELPGKVAAVLDLVASRRQVCDYARRELTNAEAHAAKAGVMAAHRQTLEQANEERERWGQELESARSAKGEAEKKAASAAERTNENEEQQSAVTAKRAALAPLLKRVGPLAQASARIAELEPQLQAARQELEGLESALAGLPAVDPEAASAQSQAAEGEGRAERARQRAALMRTELDRLAAALEDLATERSRLAPLAGQADALTQAEARQDVLLEQIATAESEVQAIAAELSVMPYASTTPALPDTTEAETLVRQAEQTARAVHGSIAVAAKRLEDVKSTALRIEQLQVERQTVEGELSDWERLAQDLGRDGLQALEIDAAGPELTELINDLLRSCVGSRWTVSVETTRQSADGKRQIEGCDVRVLDTERGREASAESLSGGERVLVGESISLALAMLACQRSGFEGITLVRDETGAALDPTNARAYVAMLRRAAEIVGASHVLFVSHNPDVQELADARIVVADGSARVAA